jgi:starch-binding outer membrane protein, SusD/RagB family
MKATKLLIALAVLASGACDFNVTDPNNPAPIGNNPSPSEVSAAVAGIVIASRVGASGWNLISGILGREAYRFDGSEPRFISELLHGPLVSGDGFGGGQWLAEYTAIRSTNELIDVIGTASALSTADQDATRGFAETFQAYEFLIVLMAHSEDSIPVAVDLPLTDPPAPFVTNDSAFTFVSALLDSGDTHLGAGGATFPFALPSGFAGFDTPATFREFNRGLKAAVEVYRGSLGCGAPCYTTAKTLLENGSTFIDTSATADLNAGVYFNYSTNPGDAANPLFQNPQSGENYVNPRIRDSAETKPGGGLDDRYTAKVVSRPTQTTDNLTSDLGWIRYPSSSAPIPLLRNEELVLLRAEANNGVGIPASAAADVNYIRMTSGGLDSIAGLAALTQAEILGAILHERMYSLLYEGHRWFDLRRTGRLGPYLLDRVDDQVFPTLPIPINEVLARQ